MSPSFPTPRRHILVWVLLATACTTGRESLGDKLRNAATAYHEGIRWKQYDQSALYVPPAQRAAFLAEREEDRDDVTVLDFEVRSVRFDATGEQAVVVVDYVWNRLPSTRIRHTRVEQRWRYTGGAWLLVGEQSGEAQRDAGEATPRSR